MTVGTSDTPQRPPTIAHIDMDSFYVSVERLKDPSLIGKPVVVGGSPDGRGVVCSASYEARAFGVRSAMPCSQAIRLCPQAIFVHGDMSDYSEYSQRVHEILCQYSPLVQMASQDEAYLDLTGCEGLWGSPVQAGERMRAEVFEKTRLPCSLGIATAKIVSKVASDLCKPRGLLWVPAGSEASFLDPLPVKRLPGIGPKTEARLNEIGLKTLGDLQRIGPGFLTELFGEHGADLYERVMGRGSSSVETDTRAKSISHEVTFADDTTDKEFLEGVLRGLCEKVASRLRGDGMIAGTVVLKYRYRGFETHTASRSFHPATADDNELFAIARDLMSSSLEQVRPIRLIGMGGSGLRESDGQLDLLVDCGRDARGEKLQKALDAVRGKHGFESIRRARSRDESRGMWG